MRRRLLLAALSCALVAGASVPAAAHGSTYEGDCTHSAVAAATDPDHFTGLLGARMVLYSHSHGNVVAAEVTCILKVNDVPVVTASGSGIGVVAFEAPMEYDATETDHVELCHVIDFTSDETPTESRCLGARTLECCPFITDNVDLVFGLVNPLLVDYADPLACTALAALAPGAGPVAVDGDGDVYVAGEPQWDCPPYDIWGEPDGYRIRPGGSWNDGTAGLVAASETALPTPVAAACAFAATPAGLTVTGSVAAASDTTTAVRCRLADSATGDVLYDRTVPGGPGGATLSDSGPAPAGRVDVCVEGIAGTATTGLHCRYAVTATGQTP